MHLGVVGDVGVLQEVEPFLAVSHVRQGGFGVEGQALKLVDGFGIHAGVASTLIGRRWFVDRGRGSRETFGTSSCSSRSRCRCRCVPSV